MKRFLSIASLFAVACSGADPSPLFDPQGGTVTPTHPWIDASAGACKPGLCAPENPHVLPPSQDGGNPQDSAAEASQGPTVIQSFCDVPGADPAGKPIGIQCEYYPATDTCNWTWDFGQNPLQPCAGALPTLACPVGTPCHVVASPGAPAMEGQCQCPPGALENALHDCFCPAGTSLVNGACQ